MPISGRNIWRVCKTYGRLLGVPELTPHDLRHGVLLGHTRIDTTQIYATIRPAQLKRAVSFYEEKAQSMLGG